MAVLAVAGAGALGASALGLGWQAGWLLGSVVGQALFAPGRSAAPDQEGPRLADLTVSSSAYGAPIPIAYGTLRMPPRARCRGCMPSWVAMAAGRGPGRRCSAVRTGSTGVLSHARAPRSPMA